MHHLVRRCPVSAWLLTCGVPLLFPQRQHTGTVTPTCCRSHRGFHAETCCLSSVAAQTPWDTFLWNGAANESFSCLIDWEVFFQESVKFYQAQDLLHRRRDRTKIPRTFLGYWVISGIWANADRRQAWDQHWTALEKPPPKPSPNQKTNQPGKTK